MCLFDEEGSRLSSPKDQVCLSIIGQHPWGFVRACVHACLHSHVCVRARACACGKSLVCRDKAEALRVPSPLPPPACQARRRGSVFNAQHLFTAHLQFTPPLPTVAHKTLPFFPRWAPRHSSAGTAPWPASIQASAARPRLCNDLSPVNSGHDKKKPPMTRTGLVGA